MNHLLPPRQPRVMSSSSFFERLAGVEEAGELCRERMRLPAKRPLRRLQVCEWGAVAALELRVAHLQEQVGLLQRHASGVASDNPLLNVSDMLDLSPTDPASTLALL